MVTSTKPYLKEGDFSMNQGSSKQLWLLINKTCYLVLACYYCKHSQLCRNIFFLLYIVNLQEYFFYTLFSQFCKDNVTLFSQFCKNIFLLKSILQGKFLLFLVNFAGKTFTLFGQFCRETLFVAEFLISIITALHCNYLCN